jgi:RNA polymerase sigma-70 factor (ECF subfamily)
VSDRIEAGWRLARTRYAGVALALEPFRAAVVELEGADPHELELGDLFLSRAAALGDARAIAAIEAGPLAGAPEWLARYKLSDAEHDEVVQRVRERLFVGTPTRPPRIVDYAGRGPLGAWVRVLLVREAASERRRAREHDPIDEEAQRALVDQSPEQLLARARYQGAFDDALRGAFAALSAEERALFRFQFGKGLTLDQIAKVLGLSRATVARRIADARGRLWRALTDALRSRLQLSQPEVDALLVEWRSKLEVSLSGLLKETHPR